VIAAKSRAPSASYRYFGAIVATGAVRPASSSTRIAAGSSCAICRKRGELTSALPPHPGHPATLSRTDGANPLVGLAAIRQRIQENS
jgi:hypothetical protein